jgi:hypothetical protein
MSLASGYSTHEWREALFRSIGRTRLPSGRPRAEGKSSIPTMISSAVTSSSSLPGRLSVSSPFEVLHRAVGRQAGGTLYPSARPTPLAHAQKALADGRAACDR